MYATRSAGGSGSIGRPEFKCNNCGQPGHKAGDCSQPKQCGRCGSTEHLARECPNRAKKCESCGEVGHTKVRCGMAPSLRGHHDAARMHGGRPPPDHWVRRPQDVRDEHRGFPSSSWLQHPPRPGPAEFRCNNCSQVGHKAGDCPQPKQCGRCGSTEHIASVCPERATKCEKCGQVGHTPVKCGHIPSLHGDRTRQRHPLAPSSDSRIQREPHLGGTGGAIRGRFASRPPPLGSMPAPLEWQPPPDAPSHGRAPPPQWGTQPPGRPPPTPHWDGAAAQQAAAAAVADAIRVKAWTDYYVAMGYSASSQSSRYRPY
jgi:hypothetical protein